LLLAKNESRCTTEKFFKLVEGQQHKYLIVRHLALKDENEQSYDYIFIFGKHFIKRLGKDSKFMDGIHKAFFKKRVHHRG